MTTNQTNPTRRRQSPQAREQPFMNSKQTKNPTAPATARAILAEQPTLNDEQPVRATAPATARQPAHRTAATATRFPDIYKNPIWGRHTYPADDIPATIIVNRNKMAEKLHLIRNIPTPPHFTSYNGGLSFDHVEVFIDAAGWIWAICGLYGGAKPPPVLEMMPTAPLHSTSAASFIGRYSSLRELRERIAVAEVRGPKFGAVRNLFTEPPTPRRKRLRSRGKVTT